MHTNPHKIGLSSDDVPKFVEHMDARVLLNSHNILGACLDSAIFAKSSARRYANYLNNHGTAHLVSLGGFKTTDYSGLIR